jgi:hypothetical protein
LRGQALHASVLDAKFLEEERDLTVQAVVLGQRPDPRVEVVLRVAVKATFAMETACTTAERT